MNSYKSQEDNNQNNIMDKDSQNITNEENNNSSLQDDQNNNHQQNNNDNKIDNQSALKEENHILQQKIADLNDRLLRSLAEIENKNRKNREELEKANKFAISNFVSDLVPVVENFFLAANNAPNIDNIDDKSVKTFIDAMFMTQKELVKILEKNQVVRIDPLNQAFDHNIHEAISQIETKEDDNDGKIVNVIQAGYKIADRLIKPALVVVAKKGNN